MVKAVIPVILCGGSGTRLWPASRERFPKQFLPLINDLSLLQNTMQRALRISGAKAENLVIVTQRQLAHQVEAQISALDPAAVQHILCEPVARNTAAAVAYAAVYISRVFGEDSLLWILPADHHIGDEDEMTSAFRRALPSANDGHLVTFGIRPTRPETGYGYVRLGEALSHDLVYQADAFVEKPDAATASHYIATENYLWNSGMFLFTTEALLNEYRYLAPDVLDKVYLAMEAAPQPTTADKAHYVIIPEEPFDKKIMEKSSRVTVVPCDPAWSDIGSWHSLWEISKKDADGNVIAGNVVCENTHGCLIHAQKRLITCAGLENAVVIDTGDAVLVANRSDGDAMRSLIKNLKGAGYAEISCLAPAEDIKPVSAAA